MVTCLGTCVNVNERGEGKRRFGEPPPAYYLPECACLKRIFAFQKGAMYPLLGECLLAAPDAELFIIAIFYRLALSVS